MHTIASREQWLAARLDLLEREKEHTRAADALARARQELPWVEVTEPYAFDTLDGERSLRELFGAHDQLLVYHLMMGPDWEAACPGCTYTADTFDRAVEHLPHRGVGFVAVSRAPVAAIEAYKARLGWSFDWVSCGRGTFNHDLGSVGGGFNFGTGPADIEIDELHGLSAFARDGDAVYHTYSAFDRGTDALNTVWQLLDRTPFGRAGGSPEHWPRRRYEYAA